MPTPDGTGPQVSGATVTFRLPDPEHRHAAVRLWQDLHLPAGILEFRRTPAGWELRLDRPPVARMEYLFEVTSADGGTGTVPDPGNPLRVPAGDRSVVEFPGYRRPAWLAATAPPGERRELAVRAPALGTEVEVTLWSPAGLADDVATLLLVANDGPEYERAASLTRYLAAGVDTGRLPPLRAALLAPGDRHAWYAADPAYAHDLATAVLPALAALAPATSRVGMGISLGALAMLHAHRCRPEAFDRLFLQSGSFFDPRYDAHEGGFSGYDRIVGFVGGVLGAARAPRPVPAVLTCGAIEENVHNNRLMAAALAAQGYDVALHEVADVHNITAWRDAFEPHLTRLLAGAS